MKKNNDLQITLEISLILLAITFFLEASSIAIPLTPIPPIVLAAFYACAGCFLLWAVSRLR